MNYLENRKILIDLYDKEDISETEKKKLYSIYLYNTRNLAYKMNPDAQYDLAQHYESIGIWGYHNPYHNVHKKFYWYTKAANNNHAAACNNLADMYERGEGCEEDIEKALILYKKSSDLGDVIGRRNYNLLLRQIKKKEKENR